MSVWSAIAIGVIAGYLFGGIPFGLIVGRLAGIGDVGLAAVAEFGFVARAAPGAGEV